MISITRLAYTVGSFSLAVDLEVHKGEYFVLLGPSGSGKTLLLESICGLLSCKAGMIRIGDTDATLLPPRKRSLGYVPQDGALFDHLNVHDNIAFALRVRHEPAAQCNREVASIADTLGIGYLLKRKIRGLSGGEKQRVALGRALAFKPSVLLLDEPVSALDEPTRDEICAELKRLQRELQLTVVHVCHSLDETRLVADRVGVMARGSVAQTGTLGDLSDQPASLHVARMLRLENVLTGEGSAADGRGRVTTGGVTIQSPPCSGTVNYFVKPWAIRVTKAADEEDTASNVLFGAIASCDWSRPAVRVVLAPPLPLVFYLSHREAAAIEASPGVAVRASFGTDDVVMLTK
jgi:molybdate/tungstate transport system ATP-binding protein